jgi:hypothetical protein
MPIPALDSAGGFTDDLKDALEVFSRLDARGRALLCELAARPPALEPAPVLEVRLLGRVEIRRAGRHVALGRKLPHVPLALLKLLAVAAEPIPATQLAMALWPACRNGQARGALDTAIYRHLHFGHDAQVNFGERYAATMLEALR